MCVLYTNKISCQGPCLVIVLAIMAGGRKQVLLFQC